MQIKNKISKIKMKTHAKLQNQKGAALLASTIIMLIITVGVAVSVQYLGLGELLMSYGDEQGERAYELAQSCANDSLLKLKTDASFSGTSTTQFTNGICTNFFTKGSTSTSIVSTATYGQSTRKIKTDVTINGTTGAVTIFGWSEVQ